jgi:hypothetical protein
MKIILQMAEQEARSAELKSTNSPIAFGGCRSAFDLKSDFESSTTANLCLVKDNNHKTN